ncbi:MAG: HAMP domain-containing protein [Butyricicoccus pullicaecorum]|mgnify:CR=1 FL=1|nr:HAMP domain-containing protein [Butyricicoccus pullicaecorum]
MRHSIKFKFFAASCAIAVAFIGIFSALNLTLYDDYYLWQREKSLDRIYDTVCDAYQDGGAAFADAIARAEDTEGVRLSIVAQDGTVTYDSVVREQFMGADGTSESLFYGLSIAEAALRNADLERVEKQGSAFVNVSSKQRGEEFLCLVGRLEKDGDYMVARIPFTYLEQNTNFNMVFLLISGGITLVFCTILAFLISRHFTRPLIAMGGMANAMAELDFSKKYEGTAKDEIGQLGQSINRLSEHLEQAIDDLRQSNDQLACEIREKEKIDEMRREFIINVSHELKTPIALIQGYAEGLREGIAETPEDREYYCTTITDEAARMNKMVMQLLSLSKLELGREQPALTDLELDELLADAVSKTALLADAKELTVQRMPSGLTIRSDFGLLEQVVGNYLTNAIRYTPAGGHIRLSAERGADGVTIRVMNEGEGVPEAELPLIWEKFYRTDKARSRESGGTGVGLSIVKATAELLGGACGACNVPGGMEFWFLVREKEPEDLEKNLPQ